MSWAPTVVSGLTEVRPGCGMREPVTTTSCTVAAAGAGAGAGACWANAGAADNANSVAPPIIVEAIRRSRTVCLFNFVPPVRRPAADRLDPPDSLRQQKGGKL